MSDEQQRREAMAPAKQNLVALTDDLMERIASLQALYKIDGNDVSIDFVLDRAITALVEQINATER